VVGLRTRSRHAAPRRGNSMKAISGKRMCRILEERGWVLDRINGSHFVYRNPTSGRSVTVPVHGNKDLKPGTQRSIMRDAGITAADL
jgi:predicted RNA binding protein YcfA (HicA-like mRNA interferase family)